MQEIRKTIKKLLPIGLLALVFLSAGASMTLSQQTGNSTQINEAEIVRLQLVGALERAQTEVKSSRKLIDAMREQLQSKENILASMRARDELAGAAIESQKREIANLRAAIRAAEEAFEIQKKEVKDLKETLDKTRRKLSRARALTKYLTVIAGVLAGVVLLK